MAGATAQEQYSLELINRLRLDPLGEFDRLIQNAATGTGFDAGVTAALAYFFVDLAALRDQLSALTAVAPLAWNDKLAEAAADHDLAMQAADTQSHQVSGELSLGQRADAVGYLWSALAENVFAYSENPDHAHAGFVIDWGYDAGETAANRAGGDGIQDPAGHRIALMNASYTEIGIDWLADNSATTSVGPWLTSQEFGRPVGDVARVLGVVYDDLDADDFYSGAAEAAAGVDLRQGGASVGTTAEGGGYALALGAGAQHLVFSGGGLDHDVHVIATLASANVKVDLVNGTHVITTGDLELVSGATMLTTLGYGAQVLRGGDADETIDAGAGDDTLFGGRGVDRLFGGAGFDTLYGGGFSDVMFGGSEGDKLTAGRGWDRLFGGQGDDRLFGEAGNDELRGGAGRDRLVGGDGDDKLWGGAGRDTFVFDASDGTDRIMDWDSKDRIDLSASGLSAPDVALGTSGANAVLAFGSTTVIIVGAAETFLEDALIF